MPNIALTVLFRENIGDSAVIDQFDHWAAQINAHLAGLGVTDAEAALEDGADPGTRPDLNPLDPPIKEISLSSDTNALDPGDARVIRVTPVGADRTINGILVGTARRPIALYAPRSATQTLTLAHQASAAQADRRIDLIGAADLTSVSGEARGWSLVYDETDRGWVQTAGSAAIAAAVPANIIQKTTQVATGANTDETTFWEQDLPANTFSADGDVVHVRAFGNYANNTRTKNLRFYFDETLVVATGAQAYQNQGWQLHVVIVRRGTTDQAIHAQFIPGIVGVSASIGDFVTDAADETAGIQIRITGTNGMSFAADVTFEGGHAFKLAAA